MINQPAADENQDETEDGGDSPTYLDLYKGEADEQTKNAEKDQQYPGQETNPLKDRPKWTDVAIVLLTAGIVFLATMQWREMINAGVQTDKIIAADERLANAMEDSVTNAQAAFDAANKQAILGERAWLATKPRLQTGGGKIEVGQPLNIQVRLPSELQYSKITLGLSNNQVLNMSEKTLSLRATFPRMGRFIPIFLLRSSRKRNMTESCLRNIAFTFMAESNIRTSLALLTGRTFAASCCLAEVSQFALTITKLIKTRTSPVTARAEYHLFA